MHGLNLWHALQSLLLVARHALGSRGGDCLEDQLLKAVGKIDFKTHKVSNRESPLQLIQQCPVRALSVEDPTGDEPIFLVDLARCVRCGRCGIELFRAIESLGPGAATARERLACPVSVPREGGANG